jgi:NADH-quinone oxidoreductase subunit G
MPKINVDGRELEVEAGRTLLQALDDAGWLMNGVDVPHYCWHPKLSIDGSCRLCQVEIEGQPKLQIACNTPVADGMVVRTQSERVKTARAGVMELLLVNHPLDCPICDQAGECKLQDYSYEYGVSESRSREPRRALKKRVDLGPTIVFDQERCILCRRCVRFCREVPGTGELTVQNRGDRSVIETFPGAPLDNDYSMNVADICPVGALTTKDFRFKIRVWFLEDVEGVCTGCARGCNIHLGVANNKVYRYVPRRNDAVNQTWICDAGRMSYTRIGAPDRLDQPLVRGELPVLEAASADAALSAAAARLRQTIAAHGASSIAGLASPHATNEDLFQLRKLLLALGAGSASVAVVRGKSDELLVHADKAANAAGARALGYSDAREFAEGVSKGRIKGAIALGHDVLDSAYLGDASSLEALSALVVIDSHRSELERAAHVVLPARVAAEKRGTLVNCENRAQRVTPAVEPAFEARDEGEWIAQLGVALGLAGFSAGVYDARAVSRELASSVPAFAGCDWDSLGDQGRPLGGAAAARAAPSASAGARA